MKKMIGIMLFMVLVLGLTACGNSVSNSTDDKFASIASSEDDNANFTESSTNDEVSAENSNTDDMESVDVSEMQQEETESAAAQEGKVLVAYFSATNTTKGVAEHIADGLNADIYEIVPVEPYTDADLNYSDNNSRTTIEMNDPDVRPAISGSVDNMEQYKIVFIGFPIWWSEAPRIISTFMESYDFSGKTIVPFCTSGSSGIGSSATNLEQFTSGATWLAGKRFSGSDSQDTIMEWVNGLGLILGE